MSSALRSIALVLLLSCDSGDESQAPHDSGADASRWVDGGVCKHREVCRIACVSAETYSVSSDVCAELGFFVEDCIEECCSSIPVLPPDCERCIRVTWDGGCGGPDGPDGGFEECGCQGSSSGFSSIASCSSCVP